MMAEVAGLAITRLVIAIHSHRRPRSLDGQEQNHQSENDATHVYIVVQIIL